MSKTLTPPNYKLAQPKSKKKPKREFAYAYIAANSITFRGVQYSLTQFHLEFPGVSVGDIEDARFKVNLSTENPHDEYCPSSTSTTQVN